MRNYLLNGHTEIFGAEIGTLIYGAGKGIIRSFQDFDLCAEPYMKHPKNTIYYFGDMDYEGIGIYENLAEKFRSRWKIIPFVPAYQAMLGKAEQIIEQAKRQAEEIVKEGEEKVKLISLDAADEGRRSGYEEGIRNGEAEIASKRKKLDEYREQLDKEYDDRIKKMEPELVDVLLKIFSEVTKVLSVDKRDLILTLVNSVMGGTEVSKNYIIRANKDDAQFLRDNKDRIQGIVGRDINIEIVEDPVLKRNQCLIDTDLGIFDCSLDIQLENLIDDIKILACSEVDYFKEK